MLAAILAMAIVHDSHDSTDPATLVNQLGSSRYASRIAAEADLLRLGRTALPALRAARDSKDAEIRTRSSALLVRIQESVLLEATPVRLDFKDVPLPEAIAAIGRLTGQQIALSVEERPELFGRRISLGSPTPQTFWEAIDAVCSAGNLHPVQGEPSHRSGLDGQLLLLNGPGGGPVSDSGAFRVQLSSIHYQSEILLDRSWPTTPDASSPNSRTSREFYLELSLSAEPRLSITRNGPIKLSTAIDDRGQALVGPPVPGKFRHLAGYYGINPTPFLRSRIDLEYPDPPSRQIKTLKGTIPIIVATRRPDPLVVSLGDSRGKSFRNGDAALSLIDYRPASTNQPATIQIAIKPVGQVAEPTPPGDGEPLGYRPDSFQQQIEIFDGQGNLIPWFPTSSLYDGEETRLTMSVGSRGSSSIPTTLRYHRIVKVNAEIPFEFRDIPIP